eukprot:TRINITY_DN1510_c0_g1_i3.p1 TRINITY_DN1510_c0_g1~~TRINITY_DN1510_c0_g1_i3.p1  ORF type:complete len:258 (-),score=19.81 TRINITY_DN1510_c0_g1_i3:35-808(-)
MQLMRLRLSNYKQFRSIFSYLSCRSLPRWNIADYYYFSLKAYDIQCSGNTLNAIINGTSLQDIISTFTVPVSFKTNSFIYSGSCDTQTSTSNIITGNSASCSTNGRKRNAEEYFYPYINQYCNQTHQITRNCNQSDCTECEAAFSEIPLLQCSPVTPGQGYPYNFNSEACLLPPAPIAPPTAAPIAAPALAPSNPPIASSTPIAGANPPTGAGNNNPVAAATPKAATSAPTKPSSGLVHVASFSLVISFVVLCAFAV